MHLVSPIDKGCSAHHLHPGCVVEICTACGRTAQKKTLPLACYMITT